MTELPNILFLKIDSFQNFDIFPINLDCNYLDQFVVNGEIFFSLCSQNIIHSYYGISFNFRSILMKCSSNCKQCEFNESCLECQNNFYLKNGICFPCDETCDGCSKVSFNCNFCSDSNTKTKHFQLDVAFDICENCYIQNCFICFYSHCLICLQGFTHINNLCIDCTIESNFNICDSKLYSSPLVKQFKSQKQIIQNIISFDSIVCNKETELSKCFKCLSHTSHKLHFIECYFLDQRFIKKQSIIKSFEHKHKNSFKKLVLLPSYLPVLANNQIEKALVNCAFESSNAKHCYFCKIGYFLKEFTCFQCIDNCLKCSNFQNCFICATQYSLKKDSNTSKLTCQFLEKHHTVHISYCNQIKRHFPGTELAKSKLFVF